MIELETGEQVVQEVRKHWFIFASHAIVLLLLLFIPSFLFTFLPVKSLPVPGDITYLFFFLNGLWFLFIWVLFFIAWTYHYLDAWIITNRRVIDVEQISFFHREVSSFRLDHIQDITVTVGGFIPTMLHFGTINAQTAGERQILRLNMVPEPDKLRELIVSLANTVISGQKLADQNAPANVNSPS